jgi:putative sigma-54 modulation protein
MKLTVTGRQTTVSESLRQDLTTKLRRLDRLLNDSAISAQCVIGRERQGYVCELTVHARQDHILHGVGRHTRAAAAVAAAVEKVRQQAQKLTDRWKTRRRAGPRERDAARLPEGPPAAAAPAGPRVIRVRDRPVKPMSLDDAVLALSGGRQPFLVFRQAATERVAILYRRPDGDFGLIEPEA